MADESERRSILAANAIQLRGTRTQLFHLADDDRIHHPFHLHGHRFSVNALDQQHQPPQEPQDKLPS
uniref:HDC15735 n=1 Tax=Drosophila melanogaster TaxID=7227 RepID=Q6IJ77_DROME|nr:TPA_inf: HDC15735 [Drosophila melanogaster]